MRRLSYNTFKAIMVIHWICTVIFLAIGQYGGYDLAYIPALVGCGLLFLVIRYTNFPDEKERRKEGGRNE